MTFEVRIEARDDRTETRQATDRPVFRTLRSGSDLESTYAEGEIESGTVTVNERVTETPREVRVGRQRGSTRESTLSPATIRRRLWREAAVGLNYIGLDRLPRGGEPTVGVTGVTVSQILGLIADGYDIDRIVREYEGVVTHQEVREALLFASRLSS